MPHTLHPTHQSRDRKGAGAGSSRQNASTRGALPAGAGAGSLPTTALITIAIIAQPLAAQVCRVSVAGLNRNRTVLGPVNTECPTTIPFHSAPFGNWGVTSNFGRRVNGRQFEGWCRDHTITKSTGGESRVCGDEWFEWNSCTSHSDFRAPNCTLYNDADCTAQSTTQGINIVGTQNVEIPVGCPIDADADGIAELGGCADVASYSHGLNFMSVYELDPFTGDSLVQTLIYPDIDLELSCSPMACQPTGSQWLAPVAYDDPQDEARIFAEMAMAFNGGVFDARGACPNLLALAQPASAASYAIDALAPGSIASIFGAELATESRSAASLPLPKALGGVVVEVIDGTGVLRRSGMLFVSGSQANFVVPPETAPGLARVRARRLASNDIIGAGRIEIRSVAPGLFTADASGSGVAAGLATYIASDGARETHLLFECDSDECRATPLNPQGRRMILSLFGVGFRSWSEAIHAQVGGQDAQVLYAGPQSEFEGLDQLNIEPAAGLRGITTIEIDVDGYAANPTWIRFE